MKLFITAQDEEGLTSPRPAEVTVNILQSSQAPAVFQKSRYTFTVPEDAPVGTSVGTVEASNPAGEHFFLPDSYSTEKCGEICSL